MATKQTKLKIEESTPWRDEEVLRELYHDKDLDQSEIAEELDTTPGTISNWMGKHKIETTHSDYGSSVGDVKTERCEYHSVCGNATAPRNMVCRDCLEVVRQRQKDGYSNAIALEGDDYTTMLEHIEQLYEIYG